MFLFIVDNSANSLTVSAGQSCPVALKKYNSSNFATWTHAPNTVLISHKAINCVTSGDSCVLLDQLYTNDGLSANGNSYEGLFPNLLQRWRSKGVDFLKELNGSWALILHDPETKEIIVSTDRFSTYPLWCCNLEHSGSAISSDFMALTHLIKGTIDYASLWSFLTRGRPVGQHSFYNEIKAIRPATALLFNNGEPVKEVEWYKPKFKPEYGRSVSYWGKELAERLEAAVHDQMKDSGSPGLLLSGGLDSRLIASIAPKETTCFTIADYMNPEMHTAQKVAKICNLEHVPIIRDEDWTTNIVEESAVESFGLWHWQHMTFKPMKHQGPIWQQVDRVMLGMGFDTFFKGNQVESADLWKNIWDLTNTERINTLLLGHAIKPSSNSEDLARIMQPDTLNLCKESYNAVLSQEMARILPMVTCIPDAWEMVQFRSIHRVPYFTNLTCLREFVPTRNIIFDNRLYDMYFRIPARIRRTGNVVRSALRHNDLHLAILIDGNTWLPTFLPFALHRQFKKMRVRISYIRNKLCNAAGLKVCKGLGSWPRFGVLWARNKTMRTLMDELVIDSNALPNDFFKRKEIQIIWDQHKKGRGEYTGILNAVASFGFFQKCYAIH